MGWTEPWGTVTKEGLATWPDLCLQASHFELGRSVTPQATAPGLQDITLETLQAQSQVSQGHTGCPGSSRTAGTDHSTFGPDGDLMQRPTVHCPLLTVCLPLRQQKRRKFPDLGSSALRENIAGEGEGKSWKAAEGGWGVLVFTFKSFLRSMYYFYNSNL